MTIFGKSSRDLIKRCKAANIEYKEQEVSEEYYASFIVSLKAGRKKRDIYFEDQEDINDFLEIDFENYSFLDRYDAIYSPIKNKIEASIYPLQGTTATIYRSILNYRKIKRKIDRDDLPNLTLRGAQNDDQIVSIGPCSNEFELLTQNKPSRNQKYPLVTIKLEGYKVDQHSTAKKTLEKIAQSIFFQIDLKYKLSINLSLFSSTTPRIGIGYRGDVELDYPTREYDEDALALYWYAKSAKNMPLQKYLAFYQVLEFYYPSFAKVSARKKIKNLLLDPSFNVDKDKDLNRVLSVVESNLPSMTDERSQLYSTLEECVDSSELRDFFIPKKRLDFFLKKNKEITEVTIPLNDKKADIIKSVASRVYDIRCRIVHTKDITGVTKPLLPNSEGAENLSKDIALIEFLAKKIIISASYPMDI
jgi:hypothetical protein